MKTRAFRLIVIMVSSCVLTDVCSESLAIEADDSQWEKLLDAELSLWEPWTAVPHSSIKDLPEGYSRGENARRAPAVGLSDPFQIYTTEQNDDGELILKVSGKVYGGLTSKASYSNYHLMLKVLMANGTVSIFMSWVIQQYT